MSRAEKQALLQAGEGEARLTTAVDEHAYDADLHAHIKSNVVDIPDDEGSTRFSFRKLWAFTGPGWLMSIAYLDPGNLESDLQAGAQTGFQLIWVLWWSTIVGLFIQLLAARLGVVTGHHLAQVCRVHLSTPLRITLWIMMEIAIIASDIQEVIGSAIAINILSNGAVKLWQGSLITAVDTFTFLLLEQAGLRKLEAFFAVLISTMAGTFGYMYVVGAPDQLSVMKGLVEPLCDTSAVASAIGIVGAVIMPHNLYLHSALVTSRTVDKTNNRKLREANFYNAVESTIALLVSFVINLFVLATFAEVFFGLPGSMDITLQTAPEGLVKHFGPAMKYIFAVGVLAAGQSSTMTGTYAGQFVMEGFLQLKIKPWKRVAITRSMAMLPTLVVSLLASPAVLNQMNSWMNILQSIQLPFALVPVLHLTSIVGVMGVHKNSRLTSLAGWLISLVIIVMNMYLIYVTFESFDMPVWAIAIVIVVAVIYLTFVLYLILVPLIGPGLTRRFNLEPGGLKNLYAIQHVPRHVVTDNEEAYGLGQSLNANQQYDGI